MNTCAYTYKTNIYIYIYTYIYISIALGPKTSRIYILGSLETSSELLDGSLADMEGPPKSSKALCRHWYALSLAKFRGLHGPRARGACKKTQAPVLESNTPMV